MTAGADIRMVPSAKYPALTAVLTVGLSLILVDAAVETFVSGSPVRWWVAGFVALYVIVSWYLWRRSSFTWSARLTTGLGFLAALLTLVPWLPHGLTDGIRLLGQSTSRVLSLFTIAAIVLAGVSLLRLPWLPRWAKIVVGALTAYGVAAFLKGLISGTDYPDLLHGESLWTRLPSWLQGAFFGALVIVPIGLLARAAQMLRATPGLSRTWDLRAVLAMAMSVLMAVSAITFNDATFNSSPEQLSGFEKNLQSFTAPANVPKLLSLLQTTSSALAPDIYDVDAKAASLRNDPKRIFEFVRDRIRNEIYEGVLRGPRGTLMSTAGNSYDKSLLIASMLAHSGYEVRLLRATLTKSEAENVVKSMYEQLASVALKPAAEQHARPSDELVAASTDMLRLVVGNWFVAADEIRSALKDSGIHKPAPTSANREALIWEAQDHCWIEYRTKGGGQWIALDATLPKVSSESRIPNTTFAWEQIPETLFHKVRIRVAVEERQAGNLNIRSILNYADLASNLNGARVTLSWRFSGSGDGWSATPVLQVEGKSIEGASLTGASDTTDIVSGTKQGTTTLGKDIFFTPGHAAPTDELVAAYLQFDFVYPSGHTETVSREIFDRIGQTSRLRDKQSSASLRPLPLLEGAVPAQLVSAYAFSFSSSTLHPTFLLREANPLIEPLRLASAQSTPNAESDSVEPRISAEDFLSTLTTIARAFHTQSKMLLMKLESPDVYFYESTPRLAIASYGLAPSQNSGQFTIQFALDIRRNDMRGVSKSATAGRIFESNILRGLLDGVLEPELLRSSATWSNSGLVSTREIMQRARVEKVPIRAITSDSVMATDEAKSRINLDLKNGKVVIAPVHSLQVGNLNRIGWWSIDLKSGETLAVMDTGLNQVFGEKGSIEAKKAFWSAVERNVDWLMCISDGLQSGAIDVAGTNGGFGMGAMVAVFVMGLLMGLGFYWLLSPPSHPPAPWIPPRV